MEINWISIAVAALSTLVVGFLWYGPLFGKAWMKETGMTEEKAKQGSMALRFGLSVVLAFLVAFFLFGWSVASGGSPDQPHGEIESLTFGHGAFHGAALGIVVALPVLVTNALFEQKSFKYMMINAGYWIVAMAIMGGIINAWPQ